MARARADACLSEGAGEESRIDAGRTPLIKLGAAH